jgi:major membrane immunogen (membrane-anchored lipoprotein)
MSESGLAPVPPAPTPVAAPPQPELIAGKFKDEAAFQQGARELFKHRGVQVADNAPVYGDGGIFANKDAAVTFYKAMAGAAPAPQQPEYVDADIDGVFKAIGLDTAKFGENLVKNKSIDDDSLKAFASIEVKGKDGKVYKLNKDALNDIFVGRVEAAQIKAERTREVVEQTKQAAFKIAGGSQENYDRLMTWAKSNIPEGELATYAAKLNDTNPQNALDAVRVLKARYDEKNGGGSPVIGTMPSNVAPIPRNYDEFKALRQRAMAGDPAAVKTLRENMDKLNAQVF